MVVTSCPARRSTTAIASRPRSGTTAVAPRVVTLTGPTSLAPSGMVDTCIGAATGSRLSVAAVLLRTTMTSSGAGGGAAVSAQPQPAAQLTASAPRRATRAKLIAERFKHGARAASRAASEMHSRASENSSRSPGEADNLVVPFVEQVLRPDCPRHLGSSAPAMQQFQLGSEIDHDIGRQRHPLAGKLIEVHILPRADIAGRSSKRDTPGDGAPQDQFRRVLRPPDQLLSVGKGGRGHSRVIGSLREEVGVGP